MSIAVWFRESDEFPNGVVTYDDHAAEVEHLTVERDEARAVAHHHAARRFVAERQVRRFLNLQRKHFGDGVATHLELKSLANQVRAALEAEDDE